MKVKQKMQKEQLTANFSLAEFRCKCGRCSFDEWMDSLFMIKMQYIRDEIAKPMVITSGARCQEYNQQIGGAKKSGHLVTDSQPARAADISIAGWSGELRFKLITLAIKYGFRGIGIAETFVHLDTKNRKSIWIYKS